MNFDSYRGVFNTDLLVGAIPSGQMELPTLFRTNTVPNRLIAFDKSIQTRDFDQWVHFFIHDVQFKRLWSNPWRYLPHLAKFKGVIAPDFSVFWGLPLFTQLESIGKSRQIASWLTQNGITVIPCLRWGKASTYPFVFDGIEPNGTVAVGTVGCMRDKASRSVFEEGFRAMIEVVQPKRIIVYGSAKSAVFSEAETKGIEIVVFPSQTSIVYQKRDA